MTRIKIFVRLMIVLTLFCTLSEGQNLRRRRIQRQQKQFEEISNQQSSTSINFDPEKTSQIPINHAIIESIFDIPIQAVKSVNELLKVLAATRAQIRLNRIRNQTPITNNITNIQD